MLSTAPTHKLTLPPAHIPVPFPRVSQLLRSRPGARAEVEEAAARRLPVALAEVVGTPPQRFPSHREKISLLNWVEVAPEIRPLKRAMAEAAQQRVPAEAMAGGNLTPVAEAAVVAAAMLQSNEARHFLFRLPEEGVAAAALKLAPLAELVEPGVGPAASPAQLVLVGAEAELGHRRQAVL